MPLSLDYPNLIDLFCNGNKLAKLVLNPDIWRVYCENNNLTAIDASEATHISYTYSTDNYCIWASGNALYIEPDKNRRYDLSRLTEISGFDVNRATNWNGGSVDGNILTVDPSAKKVTYTYIIKEKNSLGNPVSETFTLNKLSYLTVKKLKTGKKYYARIRTYKIVKINGKNVKLCSYWSNIKSVKTK